jgi:hypothetical protein
LEVLLLGFKAFAGGLELFAVVEMGFISVLHFFGVEVDLELDGVDFLFEELFALLRILQFFGCVFAHQEEVFLLGEEGLFLQHFVDLGLSLAQPALGLSHLLL